MDCMKLVIALKTPLMLALTEVTRPLQLMVLNQLCTPVPIDAPICCQSVFSKTLFSPAANPAPSVAQSDVLRKVLSILNTRFKPSEISLPRFAQSKPDTRPFRIRAIRFAHSTAIGCTVTIQSSTALQRQF